MDRVVNFRKREVLPRRIPAFLGWSSELVKAREKIEMKHGSFGLGRVNDVLKIEYNQPIAIQSIQNEFIGKPESCSRKDEVYIVAHVFYECKK